MVVVVAHMEMEDIEVLQYIEAYLIVGDYK